MIACLSFSESVDLLTLLVAVGGLWLVLRQIRQVNEQLFLQHFSDYTKRYQEIVLEFPESINEQSFDLANDPKHDYVMRQMRAYADLCFEEWFLHSNFSIHPKIWATWNDGMDTAFSKRAFRDAWAAIKKHTKYGPAFEAFIDEKALRENKKS